MKLFLLCLIAGCAMAIPADYTEEGENGKAPSEFFMKQMHALLANNLKGAAEIQNTGCNFSALEQGSTVALQSLYSKRNWLGCSGNTCVKDTCPSLYMEGSDWEDCPADVYQIYRRNGPGSVRVGNAIGLYHPHNRHWFSMFDGTGHRDPCPGTPTSADGFESADRWEACSGEVFRIYARGKSNRDVINEHDAIFLFYAKDNKWVSLDADTAEHRTCPGAVRPPPSAKYDVCWGEVFEVWKR